MDPFTTLLGEALLGTMAVFVGLFVAFIWIATYMYHWEPVKGGIEEGGLITIMGITSFPRPPSQPGVGRPFTAIWRNVTSRYEYRQGTMAQIRTSIADVKQQIRKLKNPDGTPIDKKGEKQLKLLVPTLIALCNMAAFGDHFRLLVGRSLSGAVHCVVQYHHLDPLPGYAIVNEGIGTEWVWPLLSKFTRLVVVGYMTDIPKKVTQSWKPISDLPVGGQWHFLCPVLFAKGAITEAYTPPPPALAVEALVKSTKTNAALLQNPTLTRRVKEVEAGLTKAQAVISEKQAYVDDVSLAASDLGIEKDLQVGRESVAMRMVLLIVGAMIAGAIGGSIVFGGVAGVFMGLLGGCVAGVLSGAAGIIPGVSFR